MRLLYLAKCETSLMSVVKKTHSSHLDDMSSRNNNDHNCSPAHTICDAWNLGRRAQNQPNISEPWKWCSGQFGVDERTKDPRADACIAGFYDEPMFTVHMNSQKCGYKCDQASKQ